MGGTEDIAFMKVRVGILIPECLHTLYRNIVWHESAFSIRNHTVINVSAVSVFSCFFSNTGSSESTDGL